MRNRNHHSLPNNRRPSFTFNILTYFLPDLTILVGMMTFQQTIVCRCLQSYVAVDCRYSSSVTIYCHPFLVINASSLVSWVAFVCHPIFFAAIVCPDPILLVSVACRAISVVMLCHRASLAMIFCIRTFSAVIDPHGSSLEVIVLRRFSFVASGGPLSCLATRLSSGSLNVINENKDSGPVMASKNKAVM